MLSLPTSMPTDAIAEAIGVVTSGQVTTKAQTLYKDLWNVGGWAGGLLLHDAGAVTASSIMASEKDELQKLADVLPDLHAQAVVGRFHAHKLGDGQLLKVLGGLIQYIPTILQLLQGLGVVSPLPVA